MTLWTDVRLRLRVLFHYGRTEQELQEEMAFHEDMAGRAGRQRELTSLELAREQCRDMRGLGWLVEAGRDLRLAVRRLRRSPGFTTLALAVLAIGIGANLALFSLVDAVLLRSLPVPHPQQLVLLGDPGMTGMGSGTEDGAVNAPTYAQYLAIQKDGRCFSGLAAASSFDLTMGVHWGKSQDAAVPIKLVSGNYFAALGLRPQLGRLFGTAESGDTPARDAVISGGYWTQRFGGRSDAVGKVFSLRNASYTVIGVAPAGFTGTTVGQAPAIYRPLAEINTLLPGRDWLHDPPGITRRYWLLAIGRLRPGTSLAEARAQIAVIFSRSVRAAARWWWRGCAEHWRRWALALPWVLPGVCCSAATWPACGSRFRLRIRSASPPPRCRCWPWAWWRPWFRRCAPAVPIPPACCGRSRPTPPAWARGAGITRSIIKV